MSDRPRVHRVTTQETVGRFLLLRAKYPQYQIPVLLECEAVVVRRNDQEVVLRQQNDIVKPPELITIREWRCVGKLEFPLEEYRDYAFVPQAKKGDAYLTGMRETMQLRPQTVIPENRLTVPAFLDLKQPDILHPIRDLLIVSHGNAQGLLELPLDSGEARRVQYEDLKRLADAGSLKVSLELAMPRPRDANGRELPFTLRFRGCEIGTVPRYLASKGGAAPPMLALLKDATGVRIVAPRYFHGTGRNPRQQGWFEYLTYSFTLYTKEAPSNLAAVAEAFRTKGGFTFFDGSAVPPEQWAKWLKAKAEKDQHRRLPEPQKADRSIALQSVKTISPVDNKPLPTTADLWYFKEEPFAKVQTIKLPAEPATDQNKRQEVLKALRQRDDFKDTHAFPQYGRLAYATLEEFVADLQIFWEPDDSPPGGTLAYFLERNQYILRIPIACSREAKRPKDAKGDVLVANFYASKPADAVILLAEEDERFFTIV